jgi:DNA-directed RNA polymerase subunit omega
VRHGVAVSVAGHATGDLLGLLALTGLAAFVSSRPARPQTFEVISVSGTVANPEGITNPPIDELLEKTSSKYALVIFAAKRARQINAYYSQLGEGLLEYVGPLVETTPQEKPLSIALREINGNLLTAEPVDA